MERLGIFVWLKGIGVRSVLRENHLVHHHKFKDECGWLAVDEHPEDTFKNPRLLIPINLVKFNNDGE